MKVILASLILISSTGYVSLANANGKVLQAQVLCEDHEGWSEGAWFNTT